MARVTPRVMSGAMELLPLEQIAFERLLSIIRSAYERFGFQPIETPVMERVDVLLTKSGGETEKQVYFAQSTGSRQQGKEPELALRFDLTIPLARYVAAHEGELTFPFRRYQIQRVYRGERVQRGRYREFYQCDIDVVGRDELPLHYDAEMPAIIVGIFDDLGVAATVRANHRRLLTGYLRSVGVTEGAEQAAVLRELDKLDKRPREDVETSLAGETAGLTAEVASKVLALSDVKGTSREILDTLDTWGIDDEDFVTGRSELREVVERVAEYGVAPERFQVDLSICRGLDYYTGLVYETFLDEDPSLGSVCSGGRYDDLASLYTKSKLPGVGISIGATRLFSLLQRLGRLDGVCHRTRVLVTQMSKTQGAAYRGLASTLRDARIPTELYPAPAKFPKQMKYADKLGIPLVVIMGDDEAEAGVVKVKEMASGEQHTVERESLVDTLEGLLARMRADAKPLLDDRDAMTRS